MLFQIHLSVCNGRVRGRDQNQTTSAIVGEPSMDLRALDRNGAARQLSADGSVTTAMRGISRSRRLFLEEREMVDRSAKRRKAADQGSERLLISVFNATKDITATSNAPLVGAFTLFIKSTNVH
jgi:hypothetical protein